MEPRPAPSASDSSLNFARDERVGGETDSPASATTNPVRVERGRDTLGPDAADRPVTLAAITGAHGITGEVRLKLFTDDLAPYRRFNNGALTLKSLRQTPQGAIVRFAEIADRTAAEALRGTALTVFRSELPPLDEGEYYHADLIGLPALTEAGEVLGRVVEVENFGAGDVIEIERPDGRRFMVPMRPEAVPHWGPDRLTVSAAFAEA